MHTLAIRSTPCTYDGLYGHNATSGTHLTSESGCIRSRKAPRCTPKTVSPGKTRLQTLTRLGGWVHTLAISSTPCADDDRCRQNATSGTHLTSRTERIPSRKAPRCSVPAKRDLKHPAAQSMYRKLCLIPDTYLNSPGNETCRRAAEAGARMLAAAASRFPISTTWSTARVIAV